MYGGYGCPADPTVVPKASDYTDAELGIQPGDERILLMQRGPTGDPSADYNENGDFTDDACFPGEKAAKAFDAGWDAILIICGVALDILTGPVVYLALWLAMPLQPGGVPPYRQAMAWIARQVLRLFGNGGSRPGTPPAGGPGSASLDVLP